jgi:hypothetical protein
MTTGESTVQIEPTPPEVSNSAGPAQPGKAPSGQPQAETAPPAPPKPKPVRPVPVHQPPLSWWDAAVGAAVEAAEASAVVLIAIRRTSARYARVDIAWRRFVRLADRGAREQERVLRQAAELSAAIVDAIATSPPVNRMVDAQLDRVLRPLVATILDDVLNRLEAEPQRIQGLVRGQRDSMVEEIVGRIRAGAASADTVVDRWTARVFRRTPQVAAAPVAAAAAQAAAAPGTAGAAPGTAGAAPVAPAEGATTVTAPAPGRTGPP